MMTTVRNGQGLYVLGPLAFGASIGLQIMMAAFMRFGTARGQAFASQLTPYGLTVSAPEYDLPIFVGGLALSLIASLAVAAWWVRAVERTPAAERAQAMRVTSLLLGGLGLASGVATLGLLCSYWFSHDLFDGTLPTENPWKPRDCYRLLIPAAMALSCALWDLTFGCGRAARPSAAHPNRRVLSRAILPALFPIFVVLAIAVPPSRWTDLAGSFFIAELCLHINYFAVGPALSFAHGQAFGAEIYSQYGIGWPWLLYTLTGWFSIGSYGAFVGIEIVYGCLYYSAWFFTLWLYLRSGVWAAIAVLLAISWQMFTGVGDSALIWMTPSSTMMRHPVDVWFFLALILHQRSGRRGWIGFAGAVTALAVFFETETGIYLLVAFAFHWLLQFANGWRHSTTGAAKPALRLVDLGAFYLAAAAVALPLLLHASRGTLFSRAFLSGWVEALISYGWLGIGAVPISRVPDAPLVLFVAVSAFYIAAIAYGVHRSVYGHARSDDVLLATLSAYGLAVLLLFVGRSHPYNLCHAAVPFAIAVTIALFRGRQALLRWIPASSFAPVLCAGLVALLLSNADFVRYPGVLGSLFREPPDPGLSLMSDPVDISGLPADAAPSIQSFRAAASAIRAIASDGAPVAIFDMNDTFLYYAADVAPWSRYAALFTMIVSNRSLEELKRDLAERPPGHVVIRDSAEPRQFDFLWSPLHEAVASRYERSEKVGDYEIWSWRGDSPVR